MDSVPALTLSTTTPSNPVDLFTRIQQKIQTNNLPVDLSEKLLWDLDRLSKAAKSVGFKLELDKELERIDFIASLPFNKSSQDILDIKRAQTLLNQNHYGLEVVKERILEYLSILILNSRQGKSQRAQVLAFVGLVGSGKTSLAYSIADALGRKLIRIPFGGLGSVKELRGESHTRPEAEPGRLLKSMYQLQVNNPVILLDEIDRVAEDSRADMMGVLVELLDPEQNHSFIDHYVDYPFNLSKALFIATGNNTANVATAVMDRLEVIEMPAYTDLEKITIASKYILPRVLKESGLPENIISFDDTVWPKIVRPLGYDAGIRSLQRHVQTVVRKVAKMVVEGQSGPFIINQENVEKYLN